MGAKMPAPVHRCFNMRNPVAKAVVLSVVLLLLMGTMLRSDSVHVKNAIVKSANAAKAAMSTQEPLDREDPEILDVPAEDESVDEEQHEAEHATPVYTNTSATMRCDRDMEKLLLLQDKFGLKSQVSRHRQNTPSWILTLG